MNEEQVREIVRTVFNIKGLLAEGLPPDCFAKPERGRRDGDGVTRCIAPVCL